MMNQPENILSKLRTHTGTLHSELEKTPISVALLDEQVSTNDYITYLQKMRGIVAFYESKVFPALTGTLPDLPRREKLPLINEDLNYLSPDKAESSAFQESEVPDPSIGYALGCMYVMEGSTLGGKVILKHVSKTLGIMPEQGGSYFAGYGEETGHYWKSFLQTLHEYSINHDCDTEIITGAKDTFIAIKHYFEQ
jgi:heme oxygenase